MEPAEHRTQCPQCNNNIAYSSVYEGNQIQCPHCETLILLTNLILPSSSHFDTSHKASPPPQKKSDATYAENLANFNFTPWFQRERNINILTIVGVFLFPPALWVALAIVITGPVYKKPKIDSPSLLQLGKGTKIAAFSLFFLQLAVLIMTIFESF